MENIENVENKEVIEIVPEKKELKVIDKVAYSKEWRDKNKDKIKEYMNRKVICECGRKVLRSSMSVHRKKPIHAKLIESKIRIKNTENENIKNLVDTITELLNKKVEEHNEQKEIEKKIAEIKIEEKKERKQKKKEEKKEDELIDCVVCNKKFTKVYYEKHCKCKKHIKKLNNELP